MHCLTQSFSCTFRLFYSLAACKIHKTEPGHFASASGKNIDSDKPMPSRRSLVYFLLSHYPFLQTYINELIGLFYGVSGDTDIILNIRLFTLLIFPDDHFLIALEIEHIIDLIHINLIETDGYFKFTHFIPCQRFLQFKYIS